MDTNTRGRYNLSILRNIFLTVAVGFFFLLVVLCVVLNSVEAATVSFDNSTTESSVLFAYAMTNFRLAFFLQPTPLTSQ